MRSRNARSLCWGSPPASAFSSVWQIAGRPMRLEQIAGIAFDHIFGRILRRALLAGVIAALAAAAIYHFTVAGTLTLEAQYGALHAQLIVAAIYTAFALISYAILWAMRNRSAGGSAT